MRMRAHDAGETTVKPPSDLWGGAPRRPAREWAGLGAAFTFSLAIVGAFCGWWGEEIRWRAMEAAREIWGAVWGEVRW